MAEEQTVQEDHADRLKGVYCVEKLAAMLWDDV